MSWILPRLVGVTRANDLLLSSRVVTGAETADWGLWNGVEPDGEATLVAAQDYAGLLASTTGPTAVTTTKPSSPPISCATTPPARSPTRCDCSTKQWAPPSTARASAALTEKRPPDF